MQTLVQNAASPLISPFMGFDNSAPVTQDAASLCRAADLRRADNEFVQMLDGFRRSGGLARLQEVTERCERRGGPDIASLSTNLARKQVICFEWQAEAWLPLFQFNPIDMTLRAQMLPVVSELSCIYGPWDLAFWFSQPNPWLADRAPADALISDLATVLQAARADRFIAN